MKKTKAKSLINDPAMERKMDGENIYIEKKVKKMTKKATKDI